MLGLLCFALPFVAMANDSGLRLSSVPSPASSGSRLPTLVTDASGSATLLWTQETEGGHTLFQATRSPVDPSWSAPEVVLSASNLFVNWADFPSIAVLSDGTRLAHGLLRREGGYDVEFTMHRGKSWSSAQRLHVDDSAAEHGFVSLQPQGNDRFLALWLDGRQRTGFAGAPPQSKTSLYLRTIHASGELSAEQLLDDDVCSCCQTSLVTFPDGGWMAAYRDRAPGEIRDISWVSSESLEPEPVHEDGWHIEGCPVNGPRLAASPNSRRVAVAWFTGAGDGAGEVRLAFQLDRGEFDPPIDVDEGNPIGRVDAVFVDDERVLVTWMEYVDADTGAAWKARLVSASGEVSPSETVTHVDPGRDSGFLRMTPWNGGWLAAWSTEEPRVRLAHLRLR